LILSLGAVVGKPLLPGFRQAVAAGLADRLAAAFVFVVRGDVADALVEAVLSGSRGARACP